MVPPMTRPRPPRHAKEAHSLVEIDDMLSVAGSVVRNRERELDAAAVASRSLLEENKRMCAHREALFARLPMGRTERSQRSSSWLTEESDMEGPAAHLVPTMAERIAAIHAGLATPPRPPPRRVSVSPAAVTHLQEANAALLARVQELEEATAKAHTDGATRMRRLQAEAETLRHRLGDAEKANEGLRTEAAQREKRVRAQSARPTQLHAPVPDYAPGATWRPDFRSLRGGKPRAVTKSMAARVTPKSSPPKPSAITPNAIAARSPARTQSNAMPPKSNLTPSSPASSPLRRRHQRANSYAGPPIATVQEEPLPFPTLDDTSPRSLAQELVAKINELSATNEDILQQRDALKHMLDAAEAEADELKRVCERLEHEVEAERAAASDSDARPKPLELEIPPIPQKGAALRDLAAELGAELDTDLDPDLPSEPRVAKPTKRGLGNRGLASRAKTSRRVRKSLSNVFASKALPSPLSSPTSAPVDDSPTAQEFVTPSESTPRTQEVYLTPVSTLRIPGGLDDQTPEPTPDPESKDSTMAQLRAALDPLFNGVVQGHTGHTHLAPPSIRRRPSNLGLVFSKGEPLEPWEAKLRDLYSEINRSFQDDSDAGAAAAGAAAARGSRRARALGRMSLRRRVSGADDDYAADDSEADTLALTRTPQVDETQGRFATAKRKSINTMLELLLLVQFCVVLVVFVYTAVRRGPKAVLAAKRR